MKRIMILIFLCLLLSSGLAVTAMAYSIDDVLGARDFSLIDTVLASRKPGCGDCVKLRHLKVTPNEVLFARASGCSSCEDEGDPNG
jgi:hypothetical protein